MNQIQNHVREYLYGHPLYELVGAACMLILVR